MNYLNQLQGYVNNTNYLLDFQKLCIRMLSDNYYLEHLEETDFAQNPTFGFTMMRVFKKLSEEKEPNIIRLNELINGSCFDECICHNHDKKTYSEKIGSRTVKKNIYRP